jgi:hypothetical protein
MWLLISLHVSIQQDALREDYAYNLKTAEKIFMTSDTEDSNRNWHNLVCIWTANFYSPLYREGLDAVLRTSR